MGNKSSTAFPAERCAAETARVANIFGPLLIKAYGVAVVRKLQVLSAAELGSAAAASAAAAAARAAAGEAAAGAAAAPGDAAGGGDGAAAAGADATPAALAAFLLDKPPTATEPLERGWVTKLGAVKRNWKKRYLVATEEADNFVVYCACAARAIPRDGARARSLCRHPPRPPRAPARRL